MSRSTLAIFVAMLALAAPPLTAADKPGTSPAPAQVAAAAVKNGWPSVSPDGEWIAFVSDRDGGKDNVFVIGKEGEQQVSHGGGRAPHWSADGTEILFVVESGDTARLLAAALHGGKPRLVATIPGRSPRLSPDGARLLFLVGSWQATELMAARADGSGATRLAGGRTSGGEVTTAWNGAWAPDGEHVAYTYGDGKGPLQVHVVNSDGTGDRAITQMPVAEGSAQMPAWSPGGDRLAIQVSGGRGKPAHIWIVDAATGAGQKLNPHDEPYLDEVPAWFPDGKRIAFQSNRSGRMEVWVMNADGSEAHQVTGTLK